MSGLTRLVLISVCASLEENGKKPKTMKEKRTKYKQLTTTN